jgi:sugar lactone lactonase YvrE
MKKVLISLCFLFIAAISLAQPARQTPGIFYKYALTQSWGGIPIPLFPTNYGAPLTLYKPLLAGFSVTDAIDVSSFRPKSMSPIMVGGGEIEVFGNTNIAYPSMTDVLNPFAPVRIFTSHLAIDNDGVLFLGGKNKDKRNKILRVTTKQNRTPQPNTTTQKELSRSSDLFNSDDIFLGMAIDPRPGKQNLIYYSVYNSKLKKKILILVDTEKVEQKVCDFIFALDLPVGLNEYVGGPMAIGKNGILYMADPDLHIVVSVDLSGDNDKKKQEWSIIAGRSGESGNRNDEQGDDARFNKPSGIAVDEDHNIYVSDAGNNCIRKIDNDGEVTTFAGSSNGDGGNFNISFEEDPKVARFRNPLGMAYDYKNKYLYVADNGNNVIRRLDLDGKVLAIDGNPFIRFGTSFVSPSSIAVDPSGFGFYVAGGVGKTVQYVNTFEGGYIIEQQVGPIQDAPFNIPFPLPVLPPGLTMIKNGSIVGIPVTPWKPTAYIVHGINSVGKSTIPGVIVIEVIRCPEIPDTVKVNDTIPFSKLPYTWNSKVFTDQGSQTVTLKSKAGCDSIVVMNLSVLPKITYNTPVVYSKDIPITPLKPINQGTTVMQYSISPNLPDGLVFDRLTGIISGTPTVVSLASITPINGYSDLPQYYTPNYLFSTDPAELLGADITKVFIARKDGRDAKDSLENKTVYMSYMGSLGMGKPLYDGGSSFAGKYADYGSFKKISLYEGKEYNFELGSSISGYDGKGFFRASLNELSGTKYSFYKHTFTIYIDLNRDGDFDDEGEKIIKSDKAYPNATNFSGSFIMPKVVPGFTRMKIHLSEANVYKPNPDCYDASFKKIPGCPEFIFDDQRAMSAYPQRNEYNFFQSGEYEDYVVELIGANGKSYTVKGSNTVGEDSTLLKIAVAPPSLSTTNLTICKNELPYFWNGFVANAAGTFIARLQSVFGSDSLATLNLSVLPSSESTTYQTACGSIYWNGLQVEFSGKYPRKLQNSLGCDSIATLIFTQIGTRSISNVTVRPADLPYTWNGNSLNTVGTLTAAFKNIAGCDSIAILNLKVDYGVDYPQANLIFPINEKIKPIVPIIEGGYVEPNVRWLIYSDKYSYDMPAGLFFNQNTGIISGKPTVLSALESYRITLQPSNKQFTIRFSVGVPTTGTTFKSSCSSFVWNGTTYTESGVYEKKLTNQYGLDSTDILRLTIVEPSSSLTTKYISKSNLPLLWNGLRLDSSGTYTKIKTNAKGCDSITTLKLYVAPILSYPTPERLSAGIAMKPLLPLNLGDAVPQGIGLVKTLTTGVYPNNIAVDKYNNIFFSNVDGKLSKIDTTGVLTTIASGLGLLGGLVIDNSGNLLIGQFSSNSIVKISPNGIQTKLAIASGVSGIAVDAMGNIYFSEFSNHRIRKIGTDGIVTTIAGSGIQGYSNGTGTAAKFYNPVGLTVDPSGNIYVADAGNNRIRKISKEGVVSNYAGNGTAGLTNGLNANASFNFPTRVSIDLYGNLFVGDQSAEIKANFNGTIRKISFSGTVSTLAGTTAGYIDGEGSAAKFSVLNDLAITSYGLLYAADPRNAAIRLINTQGYQIKPDLSAGLVLDPVTGIISGTPLANLPKPIKYSVYASNFAGIDSTTLELAICSSTPKALNIDTCNQYIWDGRVYDSSGTYTKLYTNSGGCDSLVTLNLIIRKSSVGPTQTVIACDKYTFNGIVYNQTGVYNTTYLLNSVGCDSLIVLNLTIKKSTFSNTSLSEGSFSFPYYWNGLSILIPGSYSAKFTNSIGCDSTANLLVNGGTKPTITYPVNGDTTFYYNISNVTLNPTNTGGVVPQLSLSDTPRLVFSINNNIVVNPNCIVKDASGNYYFTAFRQHQIFKMLPDGTVSVFAGTSNEGNVNGKSVTASFKYPLGLAFDNAGNLYVADYGNGYLRKISADGNVTTIGGYNYRISAVRFNQNGELFVSEEYINKVSVLTGTRTRFINSSLEQSSAMIFDIFGNMIVIQTNQVKRITPDGQITVIAGDGNSYTETVDGYGAAAKLKNLYPAGALYVNPRNNMIYFSDIYGQLYRIEPDGFVRKIFWLQTGLITGDGLRRNDVRSILDVDDAGIITYLQGSENSSVMKANTQGYGFMRYEAGTYYTAKSSPKSNEQGIISGNFEDTICNCTSASSKETAAFASNQFGVSIYPMTMRVKKLINYVDVIRVSGFPYTWKGKIFNAPTDTATVLSTNKTLANDTLYRLNLIYEKPEPTIITSDINCATNALTLNASSPAGNATYFNGNNPAIIPYVKDNQRIPYVDFYQNSVFNPSSAFEAWIKPESVTGKQYIIAKDSIDTRLAYFAVLINDGKLQYDFNKGTGVLLSAISSTNIQPGIWTHIAVTHKDSAMSVYINGVLSGTNSNVGRSYYYSYRDQVTNQYIAPDFTLGGLGTQFGFKGYMDEVRMWSTPLTSGTILANMNKSVSPTSSGLALYYRFDESGRDTLVDQSLTQRNATFINVPVREIPSTAPIYYNSYLWSPGGSTSRNITVNPTVKTLYKLSVTDYKGAVGVDSLEVPAILKSTTIETIRICAASYTWHNVVYTTSNNTATWTVKNKFGCDSVVTLNLTLLIPPVPAISGNVSTNLCKGGAITLSTGNYVTYNWSNGAATQSITVSPDATTTYTVSVTDANGCTGIASKTVYAVLPTSSIETIVACSTYTWHGKTYTASNNTDTWTVVNNAGCDSVVTLNLTINPLPVAIIAPSNDSIICGNGVVELSARASGSAIGFEGKGLMIEDSMGVTPSSGFTLEAWVKISSLKTASTIIGQINGNRVLPFDTYVNSDGTVSFEVGNATETSKVTTASKLMVNKWHHLAFVYASNTIKVFIDGIEKASGISIVPASNIANNFMIGNRLDNTKPMFGSIDEVKVWNKSRTGSDILSTMNSYVASNSVGLAAYYKFDDNNSSFPVNSVLGLSTATLIEGKSVLSSAPVNYTSYIWSVGGATTPTLRTSIDGINPISVSIIDQNGCSNSISTILKVNKPSAYTETVSACGAYTWHGTIYTSSTNSATWVTQNAAGCDSVVTLNLTIGQPSYSTEIATACNYYVWHGKTYSSSTNAATWKGVNAAGCDSIVTLNLTIRETTTSVDTVVACGNVYTWHDLTYTSATNVAVWIGVNAAGCDSIVTLNLSFTESPAVVIGNGSIMNLCQGDTITLSDQNASFSQFATKVKQFSSQFYLGSYSANQILGEPNTFPEYGDLPTAWSPLSEKGSKEFIELEFTNYKKINFVDIYETFNPGSIDSVFIKNVNTDQYELVYTASPDSTINGARILPISFPLTDFPVSMVKITMNSPAVSGFKGIDAVAVGQQNAVSYVWSDGVKSSINKVSKAGKYFLTATDASGCMTMDSVEIKTIVLPSITTVSQTICSGAEFNLFAPSDTASTSYYWSAIKNDNVVGINTKGLGAIRGKLINNSLSPQTLGFIVTPTNEFCIGKSGIVSVLVNPSPIIPTISVTGTSTICQGDNSLLTSSNAQGNQWYLNGQQIAGATNSTYTANVSGNYRIRVTDNNACISDTSLSTVVIVNALPVVASITGTASVCVGATTALANATASGVWSSGTPAVATVSATGVVTGISSGTSLISYTVTNANGCVTSVSTTVTVNALPVVANITGTTSVCVGSTTALSNATAMGVWSSGTPAVATVSATGIVTAISSGTSVISYTVTNANGCVTSVSTTITVNALPVVANITGTTSVCVGAATALSNATAMGVWSSGTTSVATVSATGVVTAITTGTSLISYTFSNANGCITAVSTTVTVNALPVIANITGTTSVCIGSTTALANATALGVWSSSTPAVATVSATGVVTGISAGISVISYTVTTNGCSTTSTATIIVNALPVVANIKGTTNVCVGSTTALSNATASGVWSSVTPAVATVTATGIVTALSSGTSVISYSVTNANGCVTAVSTTITVNALPVLANITGTASVCVGSTTALSNATAMGVWSSATPAVASVSATGVVAAISSGTSVISYTVTSNGCSTTSTSTITVNALPVVASITGTTSVCVGATTALSNSTASGVWSSGTPAVATVSTTGVVTAITAGKSVISYIVTNANGCVTAVSTTITVNALPVVANITGTTSVCVGSTTALANATASGVWSSGTPAVATVSTTGVVAAISSGTSVISYTVTNANGCVTSVSTTISVNALPVVANITGTTSVCVGSTTALSNATASGVWSSGTTSVASVSASGVVTGISVGTSVISYIVSKNGCSTSVSQTISVIALPSAPVVNVQTYCELAVTNVLTASGSTGNSLTWYGTSATGGTGTSVAPKPTSATAGTFNYYVSQTNPSTGCESPRAKLMVTIYPIPGKVTITRDATGTLVSNIPNGNQWFWNGIIMIGDTTQRLKPVQSGPYSIILIQNGCWGPMSDSYYNLITAIPTLTNNEFVRLYPNPVQSTLTIDFSLNGYKQVDFKLYDMTGKLISEKKKLLNGSRINLSGLVAGMYRYQILGSDGRILYSDKFMKD